MIETTQQNTRFDCLHVVENDVVIGQNPCLIRTVEKKYRTTLMGTIPAEWGFKSLKEIVINKKGSIKIGPFGSQLKLSDMSCDWIKVYGQENVIKKDLKLGNRYINIEKYKTLKTCTILPGDLVITMMGTIGKCMIFPNVFEKGIMDSHLIRIQLNPSIVHTPYFAHIFESYKKMHDQINQLSQGGIMSGLSSSIIKELHVPLPSLPEQQKIAAILSSVDAAIKHTESIITKLNDMKVGLFHDLLTCGINECGKLRDPEAHPELFKNVPLLGQIPGDWNASSIGSIAVHVGSGITPKGGSKVYKEKGIPFIRSQNVTFDGLLLKDIAHIDVETHEKMKRSEVFAHDVLLNITGASIGRCCPLPDGIAPANVNQHVCAIRLPKPNREDAILLSSILASPIGQSQIDRFNAGGNREGLNYEQLRSFIIPWPPQEDRKRIARIIAVQNSRLSEEEAYLNGLKQLKKGLMQDLLTGRILVKVDSHA